MKPMPKLYIEWDAQGQPVLHTIGATGHEHTCAPKPETEKATFEGNECDLIFSAAGNPDRALAVPADNLAWMWLTPGARNIGHAPVELTGWFPAERLGGKWRRAPVA